MRTDPLARKFMIGHAFGAYDYPHRGPAQDQTVQENAAKFSIIQGEADPIKIGAADLENLKKAGVHVFEFPGAGHSAFCEVPADYAAKVAEFSIQE